MLVNAPVVNTYSHFIGVNPSVRRLGGRHARRPRWFASASDGWQDVLRDDAHMTAGVTAEVEHRLGARDCCHGDVGNVTGRAHWIGQSIRLATISLRDEHHEADEPSNALDRSLFQNGHS
jgi:hypothetical protein